MIAKRMLAKFTCQDKYGDIFNTPFFVLDEEKFESNVKSLSDAIRRRYRNVVIGYSYKTNFDRSVLNIANRTGLLAEVVSPAEYELALATVGSKERIIYNGVIPDLDNKMDTAQDHGFVNIESSSELHDFVCEANKRFSNTPPVPVGIRLNIGITERTSRFGIDIYDREFEEAIRLVEKCENVYLRSVHCHIHGAGSTDMWKRRTEVMGEIAKTYGAVCIDLGGGMYSQMRDDFRSQFREDIPTFDEYGEAVGSTMKNMFPLEDEMLILECGTPLIANAVTLVSSITDIKHSGGRYIATCDTSVYDLGFLGHSGKQAPWEIIHQSCGERRIVSKVYGYACTEEDVLVPSCQEEMAIGDKIVFYNVGAYTSSLESNFIKSKTPIYSLRNFN